MTLGASKPKLEQDIRKILEDAFYEAEMTTKDDGGEARITSMVNELLDKTSRKKAQTFADKAYQPLAQAIYDFVSEIGITLTPKGTLMAPQAISGILPVTGIASTTTQDIIVT